MNLLLVLIGIVLGYFIIWPGVGLLIGVTSSLVFFSIKLVLTIALIGAIIGGLRAIVFHDRGRGESWRPRRRR